MRCMDADGPSLEERRESALLSSSATSDTAVMIVSTSAMGVIAVGGQHENWDQRKR